MWPCPNSTPPRRCPTRSKKPYSNTHKQTLIHTLSHKHTHTHTHTHVIKHIHQFKHIEDIHTEYTLIWNSNFNYFRLVKNLDVVKGRLNRPLTLSEKVQKKSVLANVFHTRDKECNELLAYGRKDKVTCRGRLALKNT